MKLSPLAAGLALGAATYLLVPLVDAHGGTYRGPGDTVPGGGGGGGGGGSAPATPSNPGGSGPTGPTTPTPGPGGPGSGTGGPGARGTPPGSNPGGASDTNNWEYWWNFNKEPFLGLRSAIHDSLHTFDPFGEGAGRDTLAPSAREMREKVVPALQRALASERSNDIVSGALVALAKIGDVLGEDGHSPLESLIAARLSDPSQEIAETAAVSLGILSSESCVPLLAALARDDEGGRKLCGAHEVSTRTRAFAAYGLGLVGARTASNQVRREIVDTLVQLVGNSKESNRELATAALIGIGLTPLEVAPDGGVLEARAAASSSRQAEIGWLRAIFSDATRATWLRAHAPWAMARLLCRERQRPAALAAALEETERSLLAALAEHTREREDVLQGCVLALGQLGDLDGEGLDAEIRSVLEREADKGQLTLRTFALIALGQSSSHPGEGAAAAKSLGQVRGFLVGRLERAPSGVRPWAALGIALLERGIADLGSSALPPDADTCGALREALRGTTAPETAGAFAVALGIARDSEAVPLLREKLAAIGDDNARGYLALALGMVGAADAREPIQALVKSSRYKPELLRQAAIALGLLGDKSLVPELVQMLREAQSLSSQAAVASALGFIGDARSIDPLVALLEKRDATDRARGFAAVALGIVGDKEPFPWNAKVSTDCNYRAAPPTLTSNDGAGLLDIL